MGVGLWFPGMGGDCVPGYLGPMVFQANGNGGLQLWSSPTGAAPSSTRAESFALAYALHVHAPIHCSLDNSTVVKRFKALLRRRGPPRRDWGM
eukprot:10314004-Alexandrium_andersonii.AAC.1